MKKQRRTLVQIFLILIVFSLLFVGYRFYLKSKNQRYTVGAFEDKSKLAKGGTVMNFTYKVNGVKYTVSVNYLRNKEKLDVYNYFIVEFPEGLESHGRLLIEYPLIEYQTPPANGWDEISEILER